ncbi:hypothetical protein HAX54_033122, partial [Datura stramonium]|nr:hypothetical protein [Datura stramonium]
DHGLLCIEVKDLRAQIERNEEASAARHMFWLLLSRDFLNQLFLSSFSLLSPFLIHHLLPLDRPIHFFLLNI